MQVLANQPTMFAEANRFPVATHDARPATDKKERL